MSSPDVESPHHTNLPTDDSEFAAAGPHTSECVDNDADEVPYLEPEDEAHLQPPPGFKPFFTLIEDPITREHHHPNVHYVFADDDQDIITNAALVTLDAMDHRESAEERFVIVDMGVDGQQAISTTSFSQDWQGLTTKVTQAPSWGGDGSDASDRGLMLRISGQEARRTGDKSKRRGEVLGLIKAFDDNMGDLEGLLGTDDVHLPSGTLAQ